MEWIQQLEESLTYIEEHLTDVIDGERLGQIAHCSYYHYQRVFSFVAGVPLAEYIRRRRLSQAAMELQQQHKVIDVALKYGYDSSTSFARAFKNLHGVSPSTAQKEGVKLKVYPRIKFQITIKGDVEMEYRIETKEAFELVGVKKQVSHIMEENYQVVPEMWGQIATDGTLPKLIEKMIGNKQEGIFGLGDYNNPKEALYFIGVTNDKGVADGFETYHVASLTWAIFSGTGPMPTAIQDLWTRIVTEWLPNSEYEYGIGPDIELYLTPNPENAVFEIWVPITKKA